MVVLAGDHVCKMDNSAMPADHMATGAELSVACIDMPVDEASGFGLMAVDADPHIVAFQDKPAQPEPVPGRPDRALVSMGIYTFNTKFRLDLVGRGVTLRRSLPSPNFHHRARHEY